MMMLLAALLLTQDPVALADARERADAARRKCATLAVGTDGLASIGLAGSGADYKLLVVVRDPAVKKKIQDLVGGDRCDGIPIHWSVRNPSAPAALPTPTAPLASAQTPEPAPEAVSDDPDTLDCYRRRCQPEWWGKPRVVWVYRNGWNGHKIPKSYWVSRYRYGSWWR